MQSLIYRSALLLAGLALGAGTAEVARAQQPLDAFLDAADGHAIDLVEARALAAQAGSGVDEARARLLPALSAVGAYTRNEVEVVVEIPSGPAGETQRATIAPYDQLSATFTLAVPLVDLSAWQALFAAERSADAAGARVAAGAIDVRAATIAAYYQLVAARAVDASARRAVATAEENLGVARARASSGVGSELDEARASADVERARQAVAEAELQVALAERSLFVLTGLSPSDARVPLEDAGVEEPPLERWLARSGHAPAVRAAALEREAGERSRDGAWMALLPVLAGTASERLTNAAGFGPEAQWALGATLTWTLDFARPAALSAREDAVAVLAAREERSRREAETVVVEAWHRVRSLVARARAARAAELASERGAEVARARYAAGTGTQLDVSQAERDLFGSEVARIQADAELVAQRLLLRLRAGVELGGGAP